MSNPNEIVTFHGIAADGAKLEIEMPRWALDAIERGQSVVWGRGGREWQQVDEDGTVTRRHAMARDE
jgi:hypothetical protein